MVKALIVYLRSLECSWGVKNVFGAFPVSVGQQGLLLVLGQGFSFVFGGRMNAGRFYFVSLCLVWQVSWVAECLLLCERSEAVVFDNFYDSKVSGM
jgi:hypothetical protein